MTAEIKPYTTKELAVMYSITYKQMRAWIRAVRVDIGLQVGRVWSIRQVTFIFEYYGHPKNLK
jgi:hypothetical protein